MIASQDHIRFQKYININNPLGPDQADEIYDDDVSAELFDRHNSTFNSLIASDVDIVVGGRGSGKTALLKCYRLSQKIGQKSMSIKDENGIEQKYDLVIELNSEITFYGMQLYVLGDKPIHRPVEMVVSEWGHIIGDFLLSEVVKRSVPRFEGDSLRRVSAYLELPQIQKRMEAINIVWGKKLSINKQDVPKNQDEALSIVEDCLQKIGSRAVVIIDSMDLYQVGDAVTDRTIGALLRFVRRFNSKYRFMRVKVALPYEIFPEIMRASANPLRDVVKLDRIAWTSTELMQMAAHRYRIFLELHDKDWHHQLDDFNLSHRSSVRKFWLKVFGGELKTQDGINENTLTFILRHTQLLPRQFILMLNYIIKESYRRTGGHRMLLNEFALRAVENSVIAGEVYSAYKVVFPEAENLSKSILGNFSTSFKYEQLEEQWKRVGRPLDHKSVRPITEFSEIVHMMIRMGVIGVAVGETDRYIEAKFSYSGNDALNTGLGGELCVHPIFVRNLGCNTINQSVVTIPSGVVEKEEHRI